MHMAISVAVAGASGYVGGEVLRIFSQHPDVEIGALTANSSVGDRLGVHQPHLLPLADRFLQDTTPEILNGHDVVVLALPHGKSAEIASKLPAETLVIDCGADHRLTDPTAWAAYYGGEHAGSWPYGLPELITPNDRQRANLAGTKRIAVPGCNVTAVTLALQPGVASGVVDPATSSRSSRWATPVRERSSRRRISRARRSAPPFPTPLAARTATSRRSSRTSSPLAPPAFD